MRPPQAICPHSDTDPLTPRDRTDAHTTILDEQLTAEKIELVLCQRDPHRHGDVAGTATEIVHVQLAPIERPAAFRRTTASPSHHGDAIHWLERANQYGGGLALCLGDDVHQI